MDLITGRDEATQSQICNVYPPVHSPLSDCNNNRYAGLLVAIRDHQAGTPGRALSSVQPPVSPALYSLQHGPKLPTDKLRNITEHWSILCGKQSTNSETDVLEHAATLPRHSLLTG